MIAEALAIRGDAVKRVFALRRRHKATAPERVSGAVAVAEARERAIRRGFPVAHRWMATPDAVAQASAPTIAEFHASQIPAGARIVDPSCGIGADLVAFARAEHPIIAWEIDPVRAVFARENLRRLAPTAQVEIFDGPAPDDLPGDAWVFFDPARRDAHGRASTDSDRWSPSLDVWERARETHPGGVAKFSPGMPVDWLMAHGDLVVFISEHRECKEACVLFGKADRGISQISASLLPEMECLPSGDLPEVALEPGRWLLDPDPAAARAGALGAIAKRTNAKLLSPIDTYLTTDTELRTADARLATYWRIRDVVPLSRKALARHLRERGVGKLVLKKHRIAGDEAQWVRDLALKGPESAALVLVADTTSDKAVICDPIPVTPVE